MYIYAYICICICFFVSFSQNLDVNLAVNNLLSRDDEEGEDVDDSQDSYMPGGKNNFLLL